ncbi:ATP-binding protein, partial [Escherichia coli]|uniref:ATP-binding protein n=2 Tax=Escherichia coli TaxID=562 RepID=UPI001CF22FB3
QTGMIKQSRKSSASPSTHADAILDRLVHGSIKIELKGESMRKIQSPLTEGDQ